MTYQETIQYLESFVNYEKITAYPYKESLKLERVGNFLKIIGNPHDTLECIHVAGTKGKGSTCAFIAYILREAGYKVGLYTSPHLSDFRERIRILSHQVTRSPGHQVKRDFEGMITRKDLVGLVEKLRPEIDRYSKISQSGPLSFFEIYTSLAFVYFKEKKVDFAVLETGLGGRFDATNIVNSLVCAITSLSYEHTKQLGNTLKKIATEKAGIIKSHQVTLPVPARLAGGRQAGRSPCLSLPVWQAGGRQARHQAIVISAPQKKEAFEVIRKRCRQAGARLFEVKKDIVFQGTNKDLNIRGIFDEYPHLKIKLLGEHQLINASVALGVIEGLHLFDINIGKDSIRKGFYNAIWPGRCEIISRKPLIVLDGAQNIASAQALKNTIKKNFSAKNGSAKGGNYKKLILVLGISKDKDIKGICQVLNSLADKVILTKANNPRATEPNILARYFSRNKNYITENVDKALDLAKKKANSEDLILVTGSLFVVGEARSYII